MSRSYRKPYCPITGRGSAAHDKMVARRAWRRAQNQEIQRFVSNDLDWDEFIGVERYEASFNDVWSWGRDGKQTLQFPPPEKPKFSPWRTQQEERDWYDYLLKWYQKLHRK